jgi:hypothetical protein
MQSSSAVSESGHAALLPLFLRWYFVERPAAILKLYGAYAQAFYRYFSFTFLIKTLVAPWKKITDDYPQKGLNLRAIAETLLMNLTTRGIGLVVRVGTIILGLLVQVALLIIGIGYLLVWIFFPLLIIWAAISLL